MKSFKTYISEELNADQKSEVDSWIKGNNSFSDALFKNPTDQRVSFPLEHNEESPIKVKVQKHIEPKGVTIKDYVSGKGVDKHGRETRLGKHITDPELKKEFDADKHRASSTKGSVSDFHIVLSRHPHDVAGMTSAGHSWEQGSCMEFSKGECNRYLKDDVLQGTHVAYLHHNSDTTNSLPIARIVLKEFSSNGHSILVPEEKTYGDGPAAFLHTVNKYVEAKLPGKIGTDYKKNEKVYNDSMESHKVFANTSTDLDSLLKEPTTAKYAACHPKASKQQLDDAIKSQHEPVRQAVLRNPNATVDHINIGINDRAVAVRHAAYQHPNLNSDHIMQVMKSALTYDKEHVVNSNLITPEHIKAAIDSKYYTRGVVKHKFVTGDELHKILTTSIGNHDLQVAEHPNLLPSTIDYIINNKHNLVAPALKNKNVTDENFVNALASSDPFTRSFAAYTINKPEHFDIAMKDADANVREAAVNNIHIPQHHLEAAKNDVSVRVASFAKRNLG